MKQPEESTDELYYRTVRFYSEPAIEARYRSLVAGTRQRLACSSEEEFVARYVIEQRERARGEDRRRNRNPCSKRRSYGSEDSARRHLRPGFSVIRCEPCAAWHVTKVEQ